MPDVFLALSRNCDMILTNCFLSISIHLGLVIRSYGSSVPSVPLLPLQFCHLLLELAIVASEVVSAFSLLSSSSSSPQPLLAPIAHDVHLWYRPKILHHVSPLPHTQHTLSMYSSLRLRLPTGTFFSWPNRLLTHIYTLEQIFAASWSLPWLSHAAFFPFL